MGGTTLYEWMNWTSRCESSLEWWLGESSAIFRLVNYFHSDRWAKWPTSTWVKACCFWGFRCVDRNQSWRDGSFDSLIWFKNIWLVVWNICFFFHSVGNFIIPTDELIFFRGVGGSTTNQIFMIYISPNKNPCGVNKSWDSPWTLAAAGSLGVAKFEAKSYKFGIKSSFRFSSRFPIHLDSPFPWNKHQ